MRVRRVCTHEDVWDEGLNCASGRRAHRHLHIADVMLRLGDKTKEFANKNEAAKRGKGGAGGGGDGGGMSTGQMRRLVESLPQYREQLAKLDMHRCVLRLRCLFLPTLQPDEALQAASRRMSAA